MSTDPIQSIRKFNRFYTKHLGVLEDGYLQSEFTLTEARVIYELGQVTTATATDLQATLGHNAGYLSRVLRKLQRNGLIQRIRSHRDRREHLLSLTESGRLAFDRLDQRSNHQIEADLAPLSEPDRLTLARSMESIHHLLTTATESTTPITLRTHRPGDIGWIVQKHAELYAGEFNWNSEFESVCAEIGAAFLKNLDPNRERCWIAERAGKPVGTIMLVKHPEREGVAKLRLLLVDPSLRGMGVGRLLVDTCLAFARDAGYHSITLWTMNVLKAARHIYATSGFHLIDETPVHSFGHDLISETWELNL
jgi:DNA-binding MarR family transcriptional regulator/GNAT superfamily N-acetyltransferase